MIEIPEIEEVRHKLYTGGLIGLSGKLLKVISTENGLLCLKFEDGTYAAFRASINYDDTIIEQITNTHDLYIYELLAVQLITYEQYSRQQLVESQKLEDMVTREEELIYEKVKARKLKEQSGDVADS